MKHRTLGSLATLALALIVAACAGDAPKDATRTASDVVPSSTKDGPSAAAKSGSVYTAMTLGDALSKDVGEIAIGESMNGSLAPGDAEVEDVGYMDLWVLTVPSATEIQIDLISSEFDPYVILVEGDPGKFNVVADDDDGGEGLNSRLAGAIDPGQYTIIVSSYSPGATGAYQLSVAGPSSGASGGSAVGGTLQRGGTVSGQLTSSTPTLGNGSHYQLWQFQGEAGEQVNITLTSDDFDTFLVLLRGTSLDADAILAEDDDGAGNLNSQIIHTLPETGAYSVVVNSYSGGATGSYQIQFQSVLANWDEQYPGGGDPNDKYAVVVGIDDYPGTNSDLRGPVDDATLVRDALVNRFGFSSENIVFLQDAQATRLGIANAIVRHLGQAGPDGIAVFFYSGHGTLMDENLAITGQYDPETGNNVDEALYVHDGILLDEEFNYLLQQIQAENTLVLVDACFSGGSTRAGDALAKFVPASQVTASQKPSSFIAADLTTDFAFGVGSDEFEQALMNPDDFVFMAASSEDQVSWAIGTWPDRDGPASLWTYYWAQVVNEVPTSTSFDEIQAMVSQRVNDHVNQDGGLDTQTAQLMGPGSKTSQSIGSYLGN